MAAQTVIELPNRTVLWDLTLFNECMHENYMCFLELAIFITYRISGRYTIMLTSAALFSHLVSYVDHTIIPLYLQTKRSHVSKLPKSAMISQIVEHSDHRIIALVIFYSKKAKHLLVSCILNVKFWCFSLSYIILRLLVWWNNHQKMSPWALENYTDIFHYFLTF